MKTKLFTLFLLAAIFSVVMVSAVVLDNPATNINFLESIDHDAGTFTITFDLTNTGAAGDVTFGAVTTVGTATITTLIAPTTSFEVGSTTDVTKTITATGTFDSLQDGNLAGKITVDSGQVSPPEIPFDITINDAPSLTVSNELISNLGTETIGSSNTRTATVTITNTGNKDFSTVDIVANISGINGINTPVISPTSLSNLNAGGEPQTVTVNFTFESSLPIGSNEVTVTATLASDETITNSGKITIEKNFCNQGKIGTDLKIKNVDITNNGKGENDEWMPLDEIEIDVEVENLNNNDKIKDVEITLGLLDSAGNDVLRDKDFLNKGNDKIDIGRISSGDEATAKFKIRLPADFKDENYKLVVKADYKDHEELNNYCIAESSKLDKTFYQAISGELETEDDRQIVVYEIEVTPSPAQCGENVKVTGTVVNVGGKKYEDQVRVTLKNEELGIDLEKIITKNFDDQGDDETVIFDFKVPQAEEKIYTLELKTYYDYEKNKDTYHEVSEDTFTEILRVGGNCNVQTVEVTADLDSETPKAVAGKRVIINANLRNTGDAEATYTVSIFGNSGWSNLVSLDPQIFTLAPGESKEVNIILSVNEEAKGDKEFTIRTAFGTQVNEQKVAFAVVPEGDAELTPFVENIKSNWFIYLIIIVNIILIIAIISVIRSMVSPRAL